MAGQYVHERIVEFHETDMAGIAHFSCFFKWMEAAEHALFRSVGLSIASTEPIDGLHIGWPRVHAECDYRLPVRFEDRLRVTITLAEPRTRTLVYDVLFEKADAPEPVATGRLIAACVVKDETTGRMRAIEIPPTVRQRLGID